MRATSWPSVNGSSVGIVAGRQHVRLEGQRSVPVTRRRTSPGPGTGLRRHGPPPAAPGRRPEWLAWPPSYPGLELRSTLKVAGSAQNAAQRLACPRGERLPRTLQHPRGERVPHAADPLRPRSSRTPVSTPPGPPRWTVARRRAPRPSGSHRVALDARAAHHPVPDLRQIARIEEVRSSEPLGPRPPRASFPAPLGPERRHPFDPRPFAPSISSETVKVTRSHISDGTAGTTSGSLVHPGIDLIAPRGPKRCRIVRRAPLGA